MLTKMAPLLRYTDHSNVVKKQLRDYERQNNWKEFGDIPTLFRCRWKHDNEYIYTRFQVVKSTASPISPANFPF